MGIAQLALLLLLLSVTTVWGQHSSAAARQYCDSKVSISQTASAQIVTGSAGNKVYICGIVLITAADQSVSLVEGTGAVCVTGLAAVMGGTSASLALVANGGLSAIAPFAWLKTATAANNLCLLQSGAGNLSGVVTYRLAP